jgi:soluble lytic murein transglycosylase-like protein
MDGSAPSKPSSGGGLVSQIQSAASYFKVPDRLLAAVVLNESGGDPHAVSKTGAQGLTQLEPETAKGLGVTDAFDPLQSLGGGALYLKQMIDRYHGNVVEAVAAYNAGPDRIDNYLAGKASLPDETRAYVQRVIGAYGGAG